MSEHNIVETALEAGRVQQRLSTHYAPHADDLAPFVIMPTGTVKSLEYLLDAPLRIRATVELRDAASFITYVTTYGEPHSLVFCDQPTLSIVAILDYHEPAENTPSWLDHRVHLRLQPTPAWTDWTGDNKRKMGQVAFAEFIEDHLPDIAAPPGAQILEMATALEAKKNVNFSSSVRLQTGARCFTFEETIAGSTQKGQLQIPDTFTLGIAPFEGAPLYQLQARLRYTLESGHLLLHFSLVRPEDIIKAAFDDIRNTIVTGLTDHDIAVLNGIPPAKGE